MGSLILLASDRSKQMMQKCAANLELAIGLPLGVVADKLMRIETELRALNMKALVFVNERVTGLIEARIETIYKTLDSIESLASDIAADIQPRSSAAPGTASEEQVERRLRAYQDD
jgi:hypothetical protein